uniref:Uncharacterized protein n=1 Tax=Parascaris univalens TaxID=6257 RepID=A0A915C276_PARUN
VKVSLLLRENKQMDDGRFILFPNDKIELLSQANPPGTMRYYEDGRYSITETFSLGSKSFEYIACTSKGSLELGASDRGTNLGTNMYSSPDSIHVKGEVCVVKSSIPPPGDELKLLSALIAKPLNSVKKGFDLSLFNDDVEERQFMMHHEQVNTKRIDATKRKKSLTKAVAELNVGEEKPKKKTTKGEDMLDLLDEATKCPLTMRKSAPKRSGNSSRDGSSGRTGTAKRKS